MFSYQPYPSTSSAVQLPPRHITEFDVLKASHKFLRNDNTEETQQTWEDKVAQKYYERLYREYAVCDLKHYKSGNFALRWRTEDEVVSGAGETTCGNTRCSLHSPRNIDPDDPAPPPLTTLELPFAYEEHGESKFALVKVVLCPRCCKKLMWKRNKEKERLRAEVEVEAGVGEEGKVKVEDVGGEDALEEENRRERVRDSAKTSHERSSRRKHDTEVHERRHLNRSRSRSPRREKRSNRRRSRS